MQNYEKKGVETLSNKRCNNVGAIGRQCAKISIYFLQKLRYLIPMVHSFLEKRPEKRQRIAKTTTSIKKKRSITNFAEEQKKQINKMKADT